MAEEILKAKVVLDTSEAERKLDDLERRANKIGAGGTGGVQFGGPGGSYASGGQRGTIGVAGAVTDIAILQAISSLSQAIARIQPGIIPPTPIGRSSAPWKSEIDDARKSLEPIGRSSAPIGRSSAPIGRGPIDMRPDKIFEMTPGGSGGFSDFPPYEPWGWNKKYPIVKHGFPGIMSDSGKVPGEMSFGEWDKLVGNEPSSLVKSWNPEKEINSWGKIKRPSASTRKISDLPDELQDMMMHYRSIEADIKGDEFKPSSFAYKSGGSWPGTFGYNLGNTLRGDRPMPGSDSLDAITKGAGNLPVVGSAIRTAGKLGLGAGAALGGGAAYTAYKLWKGEIDDARKSLEHFEQVNQQSDKTTTMMVSRWKEMRDVIRRTAGEWGLGGAEPGTEGYQKTREVLRGQAAGISGTPIQIMAKLRRDKDLRSAVNKYGRAENQVDRAIEAISGKLISDMTVDEKSKYGQLAKMLLHDPVYAATEVTEEDLMETGIGKRVKTASGMWKTIRRIARQVTFREPLTEGLGGELGRIAPEMTVNEALIAQDKVRNIYGRELAPGKLSPEEMEALQKARRGVSTQPLIIRPVVYNNTYGQVYNMQNPNQTTTPQVPIYANP